MTRYPTATVIESDSDTWRRLYVTPYRSRFLSPDIIKECKAQSTDVNDQSTDVNAQSTDVKSDISTTSE